MAFASFLVLWGVYFYLRDDADTPRAPASIHNSVKNTRGAKEESNTLLTKTKIRELDKIGTVINEDNADLDQQTKNQIRVAKKVYDANQSLAEKQVLLEQSYMDHASTVKDIKHLQDGIVELKKKLKIDVANTEKWDPKFVYYLMLQENYTYNEINLIKSLAENGLNAEEVNYINELIKDEAFNERIMAFKSQTDLGRAVASVKKKSKEKDEFMDGTEQDSGAESKLIEMNYNQENN